MPAQSTANYRIPSQFKINLLKKKRKGSKEGGKYFAFQNGAHPFAG